MNWMMARRDVHMAGKPFLRPAEGLGNADPLPSGNQVQQRSAALYFMVEKDSLGRAIAQGFVFSIPDIMCRSPGRLAQQIHKQSVSSIRGGDFDVVYHAACPPIAGLPGDPSGWPMITAVSTIISAVVT